MPAVGKKLVYGTLGFVATGLGILGVWLPGLPTTVFILIALWSFSHSSQRLHAWLLKIPLLKIAIQEAHRFQKEGTVDPKVKFISQASSWISFISVTIAFHNFIISLAVGALALSCSIFMYYIPSTRDIKSTNNDME